MLIEAERPILLHGAVANVIANVELILTPLREAEVQYGAEYYDENIELLQELKWGLT